MALLAVVTTLLVLSSARGDAHKPITSPYTYNEDVFPILRERCGQCHVAGGVAPMSLMTYKDAFPWGESIRTELIAGHMPPGGTSQSADAFRNAHVLTARELNGLMVWVTGGNPMGNADKAPPPVDLDHSWPLGTPDRVVAMPGAFAIAADKIEDTQEFTLASGVHEARLLRAVDLRPGTPAIVRSATISVKAPVAADAAAERTLAIWVPGDRPVPLEGQGFQLPADAELTLRVHYKKTWEHEREAMTDRSSVGLYFAPAAAAAVRALAISADGDQASFTRTLDEDLSAIAIYPHPGLTNVNVDLHAERPDGSRVDLIRFRPQPDWARRFWFKDPIALPKGTRVTASLTFADVLLPPGAAPVAAKRPQASALQLTLNVVALR